MKLGVTEKEFSKMKLCHVSSGKVRHLDAAEDDVCLGDLEWLSGDFLGLDHPDRSANAKRFGGIEKAVKIHGWFSTATISFAHQYIRFIHLLLRLVLSFFEHQMTKKKHWALCPLCKPSAWFAIFLKLHLGFTTKYSTKCAECELIGLLRRMNGLYRMASVESVSRRREWRVSGSRLTVQLIEEWRVVDESLELESEGRRILQQIILVSIMKSPPTSTAWIDATNVDTMSALLCLLLDWKECERNYKEHDASHRTEPHHTYPIE